MSETKPLRMKDLKQPHAFKAKNIVVALCSSALAAFVSYSSYSENPILKPLIFALLFGAYVLYITTNADTEEQACEALKEQLKRKSKDYLIAYSESQEVTKTEKRIAINVLNECHEGWSLER
ncbi:TPA: hypothetical protein ACVO4S_001822 [Vibrio diabolicus]